MCTCGKADGGAVCRAHTRVTRLTDLSWARQGHKEIILAADETGIVLSLTFVCQLFLELVLNYN